LKEEALDSTLWRTRFGRGFGPVVRETTEWMKDSSISLKVTSHCRGKLSVGLFRDWLFPLFMYIGKVTSLCDSFNPVFFLKQLEGQMTAKYFQTTLGTKHMNFVRANI
jgi:hypothetical protein